MRATGRTTRIIDEAIQTLFNNKEVKVYDHHPTRESHERVLNLIIKRLDTEHRGLKYEVNKNNLTIKLI